VVLAVITAVFVFEGRRRKGRRSEIEGGKEDEGGAGAGGTKTQENDSVKKRNTKGRIL
jgi:hypothetical protein